ncbi:MAG TPA: anaerobic ribonucleoside-triphosphate reductase [Candidatus Methanomethylophilaceae archaeon]|nr:anaerobic ribonucleoside-triphosphate reductase [Candidatus Methanomethylophilaceae archaeon]
MDTETRIVTKGSSESTDIGLFVRSSDDDLKKWDKKRIYDALIRETDVSELNAMVIANDVDRMVKQIGVKYLTAPLIRELTNAKLMEHGLEEARKQHTRLGVPIYDAREIIMSPNKENANVPHGPEATNLTLAENIKKEFALLEVFTPDVADAHMSGLIHLHDLGMIDRPYCGGQSIEYVKKFGLNLPNAMSIAKPAKHPEVLIEQIVKFSAALQGHFAGAIGWDAFNVFTAPYLVDVDDKRMHQLAQILIYEFAQQAVARGGQSIFSDLNIYWETPKHFVGVPAIGPGGEFTGKNYEDYEEESQRFAMAMMDVYLEGDANERPFFFPKPEVHITDRFFETPGHEEFMHKICELAAKMGNTYFVFDRGDTARISECCRLSFNLDDQDLEDAKTPWKMRFSAMQNVTLNLPRLAYMSKSSDDELFSNISEALELVMKAHGQKKEFIQELISLGNSGPLGLLTMDHDGEPYYRIEKSSYLIGVLGLNEMVQFHTGKEMHESKEALMFGLKAIAYMRKETERLSEKSGLKLTLEQTPGESTVYRLAKLDLRDYPKEAGSVVKGNRDAGEVYYTNSSYLNVGSDISPIERVKIEGMFHPLIDAGALTHVWLGESEPSPESVASFVKNTFEKTQNGQIAFSPEFTSCLDCGKTSRGLKEACPYCSSVNIEGITRVTGFFSKISGWNKGKLGELVDRRKGQSI